MGHSGMAGRVLIHLDLLWDFTPDAASIVPRCPWASKPFHHRSGIIDGEEERRALTCPCRHGRRDDRRPCQDDDDNDTSRRGRQEDWGWAVRLFRSWSRAHADSSRHGDGRRHDDDNRRSSNQSWEDHRREEDHRDRRRIDLGSVQLLPGGAVIPSMGRSRNSLPPASPRPCAAARGRSPSRSPAAAPKNRSSAVLPACVPEPGGSAIPEPNYSGSPPATPQPEIPLLMTPASSQRRPPVNRRKNLGAVTLTAGEGGFALHRSSNSLKGKARAMPMAKLTEKLLCPRLGIVNNDDQVTEEAIIEFAAMGGSLRSPSTPSGRFFASTAIWPRPWKMPCSPTVEEGASTTRP